MPEMFTGIKEIAKAKKIEAGERVSHLKNLIQDSFLDLRNRRGLLETYRSNKESVKTLESEVVDLSNQFAALVQNKTTEVNQAFSTNADIHPYQQLFKPGVDLSEEVRDGWMLYASEIPISQIQAAIQNAELTAPVFTEEGEATQVSATFLDPSEVHRQLEPMVGSDNVFNLQYSPRESADTYYRFFSPESNSDLLEGGGDWWSSTGISMYLESQAGQLNTLDIDLDHRQDYTSRTGISGIPQLTIRQEKVTYDKVKQSLKFKKQALEKAKQKLEWALYALNNVSTQGGEYYGVAHLFQELPDPDSSRRKTKASVYFEADPKLLQKKVDIHNPQPPNDTSSRFDFTF